MGKRDIPVPKRSDEFASLENELLDAIASVESQTRSAEQMLASYAEPEASADGTAGEEQSDDRSSPTTGVGYDAEPTAG